MKFKIQTLKKNNKMNLHKLGNFKHLERAVNTPCNGGDCHHRGIFDLAKMAFDLGTYRQIWSQMQIVQMESFLNCQTVCENIEDWEFEREIILQHCDIDICDYYFELTGKHMKGCRHLEKQTRSGKSY